MLRYLKARSGSRMKPGASGRGTGSSLAERDRGHALRQAPADCCYGTVRRWPTVAWCRRCSMHSALFAARAWPNISASRALHAVSGVPAGRAGGVRAMPSKAGERLHLQDYLPYRLSLARTRSRAGSPAPMRTASG